MEKIPEHCLSGISILTPLVSRLIPQMSVITPVSEAHGAARARVCRRSGQFHHFGWSTPPSGAISRDRSASPRLLTLDLEAAAALGYPAGVGSAAIFSNMIERRDFRPIASRNAACRAVIIACFLLSRANISASTGDLKRRQGGAGAQMAPSKP